MIKKSIIIFVSLIIVLIAGIGFWKWQEIKKVEETKRIEDLEMREEDETKKQEDLNIIKDETIDLGDWKMYKNYEYGFEVKYPKDWEVEIFDNTGYDKFKSYYFKKSKYIYLAVFPTGAFGHGIQDSKITYEKFKGKDAKMFWYDKPNPNFIFILNDNPKNWNENNRIELRGSKENDKILQDMYNDFKFIE